MNIWKYLSNIFYDPLDDQKFYDPIQELKC